MEREGRRRPDEEPNWQELLQEYEKAENVIQLDGVTTPEALNAFLSTGMRYNKIMAHGVREEYPLYEPRGRAAEEYSENAGSFMKAFQGTYTKEKATFCLTRAQTDREMADSFENREWGVSAEEKQALVKQKRHQAANWLRMSAVCLETSEPAENI